MKNNKFIILFISFFLFLSPVNAYSADGYNVEEDINSKCPYNSYNVTNYDVNIDVKENHVLNIEEKITVLFNNSSSHGIFRGIPYKNNFHRVVEGKEVVTGEKTILKDIKVNRNYTTSKENDEVKLKIGDASVYMEKGVPYEYIISYTYDYGDDLIDEYDDLYHNLLPKTNPSCIENVNFKITMPKDFDKEKINFTSGLYGNAYNKGITYSVSDNVIKGSVDKDSRGVALYNNEGLTVRIELPEGYYVGERVNHDYTKPILIVDFVIILVFVVFSTMIFILRGRKKGDVLLVEFTVPDDMTPAEIGYIYKGHTENKQIVSLITYFANKGYLEIIEDKKKFKLKKIKEIDDSEPDYARITFEGLFRRADSEGVVKSSQLEQKFYTTLSSALAKLRKTHKIYEESHYLLKTLFIFIGCISIGIYVASAMFFT